MTNEIWAAVIIAAVQIIHSTLTTMWQITATRANTNPEQKKFAPKKSLLKRIVLYVGGNSLHITIPLLMNVSTMYYIQYNIGIGVFFYIFFGWTIFLVTQQLMMAAIKYTFSFVLDINHSILDLISESKKDDNDFKKHALKRLSCHESILFDLTDKPCKLDGECKFEIKE